MTPAVRTALTAAFFAVLLVPAAPADAKIVFDLSRRPPLVQGRPLALRAEGCSSARPCRWAAGLRVAVAREPGSFGAGVPSRGLTPVGVTSRFGVLRGTVPRVRPGAYRLVVTLRYRNPGGAWRTARAWASTTFHIEPGA